MEDTVREAAAQSEEAEEETVESKTRCAWLAQQRLQWEAEEDLTIQGRGGSGSLAGRQSCSQALQLCLWLAIKVSGTGPQGIGQRKTGHVEKDEAKPSKRHNTRVCLPDYVDRETVNVES
ncbi:unnamed protein product [Boreogadus saida]